MRRRSVIAVVIVAVALVALAAWISPPGRSLRRRVAANALYEHAVAAYMLSDIEESRAGFAEIAQRYRDLPIGALAELKLAFFAYDEDKDIEGAEVMFRRFLQAHPEGITFFLESPAPEYEGELELVAEFFLGRIAQDRSRDREARRIFEAIVAKGSRNEANLIVAETKTILRRMEEEDQQGGADSE